MSGVMSAAPGGGRANQRVSVAVAGDVENTTSPPSRLSHAAIPRLVARNRPFNQSDNKVQVNHLPDRRIFSLLFRDWFHVILRYNTFHSLSFLLIIWTSMIIVFACIYMTIGDGDSNPENSCGLAGNGERFTFTGAFAFSLETCTTVGYGLPNGKNSFFEDCNGLITVIYFQMVWSMMFNAFLTAFLFSRTARSDTRGAQVIFAKKAVVSYSSDDGQQIQLQIRCYDADAKHPVVEAHVRLYCIHKVRPAPKPLRILRPDDDLGSMLFLSFPTLVTHSIDRYSMLHPPSLVHDHTTATVHPAGLDLRQVDSVTANREEVVCPVCAESYGTHERWRRHVRYQKMVEEKEKYPKETSHLALTEADLKEPIPLNIKELQLYFAQTISEIIVLVEGIDPLTSGTFSALQSYMFEDIVWHDTATYTPCMRVHEDYIQVDLDKFHSIDCPPVSLRHLTSHDFLRPHSSKVGYHDDSEHIDSSNGDSAGELSL